MKKRSKVFLVLLVLSVVCLLLAFGCTSSTKSVTGNAVKTTKVSKNIEIKGSDTLVQLVSNLAEAYTTRNPSAKLSVTGGGSGTGIASLINGEIDIADASRPIKEKEINLAKDKGIEPWEFRIARDMLSVIVHEDNPVSELSMEQVGDIFKGGITNWNDVGGNDEEITLYGRQSTSGTYVFFMEHVVQADYSANMRNMEGNQAILDAVIQDNTGIGYVGLGYIVDDSGSQIPSIKVLKVAADENSEAISPLNEAKQGDYAVSRALFQYLAKKPVKGSPIHRFIQFELSDEGQEIVKNTGYVAITAEDRSYNEELLVKI